MVATVHELSSSGTAVSYYEKDGYCAKNGPGAPQGELLARQVSARSRPSRPCGAVTLRIGAVGPCAEERHPCGQDRRGRAPAPFRLGHHFLRPEVGVPGSPGDGRCPRDPRPRRGGAGDTGLDRDGPSPDPGLGPRDGTQSPGEGRRHGGGGLSPSDEPAISIPSFIPTVYWRT